MDDGKSAGLVMSQPESAPDLANGVTSIIPPRTGLAGVAQNSMDVDDGGRTVAEASQIIANMELEPATAFEYRGCLERIKRN